MFFLIYISGIVLVISIVLLTTSVFSFWKAIKPTISLYQSVAERIQKENIAIKVQADNMKSKQQEIKNDIEWKKAVFSHTIEKCKKLPTILFHSSSKQKAFQYLREM